MAKAMLVLRLGAEIEARQSHRDISTTPIDPLIRQAQQTAALADIGESVMGLESLLTLPTKNEADRGLAAAISLRDRLPDRFDPHRTTVPLLLWFARPHAPINEIDAFGSVSDVDERDRLLKSALRDVEGVHIVQGLDGVGLEDEQERLAELGAVGLSGELHPDTADFAEVFVPAEDLAVDAVGGVVVFGVRLHQVLK